MIDDDEAGLVLGDQRRDLLDLAGAQQRRRPRGGEGHDLGRAHVEVDGSGKANGLFETVLDANAPPLAAAPLPLALRGGRLPRRSGTSTMARVGARRRSTGPRRDDLGGAWCVRDGYPCCWGSAGSESMRCTGAPGMMVDMACL